MWYNVVNFLIRPLRLKDDYRSVNFGIIAGILIVSQIFSLWHSGFFNLGNSALILTLLLTSILIYWGGARLLGSGLSLSRLIHYMAYAQLPYLIGIGAYILLNTYTTTYPELALFQLVLSLMSIFFCIVPWICAVGYSSGWIKFRFLRGIGVVAPVIAFSVVSQLFFFKLPEPPVTYDYAFTEDAPAQLTIPNVNPQDDKRLEMEELSNEWDGLQFLTIEEGGRSLEFLPQVEWIMTPTTTDALLRLSNIILVRLQGLHTLDSYQYISETLLQERINSDSSKQWVELPTHVQILKYRRSGDFIEATVQMQAGLTLQYTVVVYLQKIENNWHLQDLQFQQRKQVL